MDSSPNADFIRAFSDQQAEGCPVYAHAMAKLAEAPWSIVDLYQAIYHFENIDAEMLFSLVMVDDYSRADFNLDIQILKVLPLIGSTWNRNPRVEMYFPLTVISNEKPDLSV